MTEIWCGLGVMSIEIEIVNGPLSSSRADELLEAVWPQADKNRPGSRVKWADADLRVMIDAPDGTLACHVGIFFRTVTWNGQKVHIGGIGGVATDAQHRRRGYAGIALGAAIQTM